MDVVVVGAGLAGLSAARRLSARGVDVTVLEARDRVGGRIHNGELAGATAELGGQWIGHTQTRMYELVDELGLEAFPTYNEGEHVVVLGGRRSRMASHKGAVPKLNPFVLLDLLQGVTRFEQMARTVPLEAPWTAEKARLWDAQTFDTWIRANLQTATGRSYLRVVAEAIFAAEATDLSLLHALFYFHAGTDFDTLVGVEEGAQEHRIVGGSALIAERMADELDGAVRLGHVVRRVEHNDSAGVRVVCEGGEVVSSDRVIVALPPTLAGRLVHEPALPALRDQLTQRVPAGSVIKLFAAYDHPFWRDEGLTGQAISNQGPVKITFDNSPPDASVGILLGFLEGNDARRLGTLGADERRREVLRCFARYFGPQAARPIAFTEQDWSAEPFTRGCYGGHLAPGVWTSYGPALRAPVGPVHWAGAETATIWNGYMEGAVRSGERAADEVLAALG